MKSYSYEVPESKTSKTVDLVSRTIGEKRVKTKHFVEGQLYIEFPHHTLTVSKRSKSDTPGYIITVCMHNRSAEAAKAFERLGSKLSTYLGQEPDKLDPFSEDL